MTDKCGSFCGAGNVTRTHDLLITNQLLYRLSYTSIVPERNGLYHKKIGPSMKKTEERKWNFLVEKRGTKPVFQLIEMV